MKHHIHTEYMIKVIEQHPSLWDRRDSAYRNLATTTVAWKEVYRTVYPNYDNLEEHDKNSFAQAVMNRWKNVRDAWVKAQKRLLSDNLTPGKGRVPKKYIFQEQLSFLRNVIKTNDSNTIDESGSEAGSDAEPDSDSSVTIEDDLGVPEDGREETIIAPSSSTSKSAANTTISTRPTRKRKLNDTVCYEESPGPVYSESSRPPDIDKENRHMLFFRSLLPSLKELKEEQVLEFQVGVLQLMQTLWKKSNSNEPVVEEMCNWKIEVNSP